MSLHEKVLSINLRGHKTRCVLAGLTGALQVFAYAPFSQGWLTPLLLAGFLLLLIRSQQWKQAFTIGFSFGLGWFLAGVSWVYVSIDVFGGLPTIVSLLLVGLLCVYLALFPALATTLWMLCRRYFNQYALFAFPFIWLITESLRGTLFTGFPWLSLGYTQLNTQFATFAPWIGEPGITLVLWIIAASFAFVGLQKKLDWFIPPVALYALTLLISYVPTAHYTGETVSVALVQGNIEQDLKWSPEQAKPNLQRYTDLSQAALKPDTLIIWPESAITYLEPMASNELNELQKALIQGQSHLISGIVDYNPLSSQFFNSLIVLGQDTPPYHWGNSNRYRKQHLLPIGEFVPFESFLRSLAPLFDLPMSSFTAGEASQPNLQVMGYQVAANICYEIAYASTVRKSVQADTDFILTVSNDAWFGRSHGPHQHLDIARMRSMELGRPLIRATNNGITAVFDHQGYLIAKAPQFEAHVLLATLPLVEGRTWYHQFGTWSAFFISLMGFLLSLIRKNKSKQQS